MISQYHRYMSICLYLDQPYSFLFFFLQENNNRYSVLYKTNTSAVRTFHTTYRVILYSLQGYLDSLQFTGSSRFFTVYRVIKILYSLHGYIDSLQFTGSSRFFTVYRVIKILYSLHGYLDSLQFTRLSRFFTVYRVL